MPVHLVTTTAAARSVSGCGAGWHGRRSYSKTRNTILLLLCVWSKRTLTLSLRHHLADAAKLPVGATANVVVTIKKTLYFKGIPVSVKQRCRTGLTCSKRNVSLVNAELPAAAAAARRRSSPAPSGVPLRSKHTAVLLKLPFRCHVETSLHLQSWWE